MSRTNLAKVLDVSLAAVSQWESGEKDPSARLLEFVEVFKEPEGFFTGPEVPTTDPRSVSFRKRHDATRHARDRAAATIDYVAGALAPEIANVFGRLPSVLVPSLAGMAPDAAADTLRKEWGLSDAPLRNVVEQLEAKGVRVFWINDGSPSLSAFCKRIDGIPFIVLNTARRDGCRSRFDACHELAHLAMHQDIDFDTVEPKEIEREADAFASAFLLPRDPFLEDAPRAFDRDHFLALKKVWGVSVQAMVRRLRDLGVFSAWQYEHAFRQMSMWGWRRQPEPFAGALESSRVHWMLCDRLEERDSSPRDWANSISLSWDRVSELMPVLSVRQMSLRLPGTDGEFSKLIGFSEGSDIELPYDD